MSDDLDAIFVRGGAEEARRKAENQQYQEAKAKWDKAVALLSQIRNPSGNPLSAQLGREPTPAEAHDWYAGLLIDYCRAIRDADPTRSLPDLTPNRDGAQLAVEVLRLAWEGNREAIKQILDRAFQLSSTLSREMITCLANLLYRLLGVQAVSLGSWGNNDPLEGSSDQVAEEKPEDAEPIDKDRNMPDSSSANPLRRLSELEGRLYKERDVLTPAEKKEMRHEIFLLRVGNTKSDIRKHLSPERRLEKESPGEALSNSIGLFIHYVDTYIDSCRELADLSQPHGIADKRCQVAFNCLSHCMFSILDYGYSLANLLESQEYSSKPVLRTLDCLSSNDGIVKDDGKLPSGFFSAWPKDRIKLGQMVVQAEVAVAKCSTRTKLGAADSGEGSGVVSSSVSPASKSSGISTSVENVHTLRELCEWLKVRMRWLRDWHMAPKDPKPVHPAFLNEILSLYRDSSYPPPSDSAKLNEWAGLWITRFSIRTIHEVYDWLETHDIFGAPDCPSLDPERNERILVFTLEHLTRLLNFVGARANERSAPTGIAECEQVEEAGTGRVPRELEQAEGIENGGGQAEAEITELDLTDKHRIILESLLELNAVSFGKRQTLPEIIQHFNRTYNPDNYKREAAQLRTWNLVNSRAGPSGGYWLTAKGKQTAEHLKTENQ
jgi:hypothetical protein